MRTNKLKYLYRMIRGLYFFLGIVFLVLAYFGILLPGIPAIPFILLAGWFFLNSSEKLYNWMLRRKIIGPALKKFFGADGVSKKMKWFIISQLWVSLIIAQFVFPLSIFWIVCVNLGGIIGSIAMYRLIR